RLSLTLKDKIENHDQKILNNIVLNSNGKHLSPQETQALIVDYNNIKNELTNAKRTIKRLNQKIIELSNSQNEVNDYEAEKIELEKINCGAMIVQTNEKKGVRYSYAVAAAGLGGGISHHATQSVLAILGVISQSCKKSYHTYQNKIFNNLVLYAKESALKALTKCLDYIEINHKKKILPISFDCSWAHRRNAKQASGEFLYQIKTDKYFHNPIIAFHTVQKTRTVENNKTKVAHIIFNGNFDANFLIDICIDGDLDMNRTLSNINIVNQIFADLKHIIKNIQKALEDPSKLTPTKEELRELQIERLIRHLCNDHNSSIILNEPTLEKFTSLEISKFRQMLQTIFRLLIGQGLVTTYRTLGNESFNCVKLVYLDKKIDYWSSYCARHALTILHNNEGYLHVLSSLRELYGTVQSQILPNIEIDQQYSKRIFQNKFDNLL
ncbi:19920_t:CDS:2, partial [Gigaspora margarita]